MELTRRDALGALGAAGVTSIAGCQSLGGGSADETPTGDATPGGGDDEQAESTDMETLVSLAEVLYPSDVDVSQDFVETYMFGRIHDQEGYRTELASGVETLNGLAQESDGSGFTALDTDQRVSLIQETELRSGESNQDGSDVERVNYYLIDELLFAFYSSPTGGELVGNPNPRGFPGGYGYSGGSS